jgi:hypothetical protein
MRADNSTGKGMSGMDKVSSQVHRVHMELGGKLLNSLRIKFQFLERLTPLCMLGQTAPWLFHCSSLPSVSTALIRKEKKRKEKKRKEKKRGH